MAVTNPPDDPFTAMSVAAAALHEQYRAFVSAGFTPQQALYLVGQAVSALTTHSLDQAGDTQP